MTLVKICGLTTAETVDAAIDAGADYLGFVHHPPSPRHLDLTTIARLVAHVRKADRRVRTVVLVVDPPPMSVGPFNEPLLDINPDGFQLHGSESVAAISDFADDADAFIIKALPIATADDVTAAQAYVGVADHLMLDARPPKGADRPGGHGTAFDWSLLSSVPLIPAKAGIQAFFPPGGQRGPLGAKNLVPRLRGGERVEGGWGTWFLAGGLTPENVAEAIRITGAPAVDVSSGVESAPGVKDPALIRAFIRAVRDASPS